MSNQEEKLERIKENKNIRAERENEVREIFAKRLTSARLASGKNKNTISQDTGVGLSMLGAYESAEKTAGVATAKVLADYLEVSLDWLCGENPDKRTLLNVNDPWLNIPPVYAMLAILNRYSPEIELGDGNGSPYVTLSFKCDKIYSPDGELLREFFNSFMPIYLLENSEVECAEAIEAIAVALTKKYINKL